LLVLPQCARRRIGSSSHLGVEQRDTQTDELTEYGRAICDPLSTGVICAHASWTGVDRHFRIDRQASATYWQEPCSVSGPIPSSGLTYAIFLLFLSSHCKPPPRPWEIHPLLRPLHCVDQAESSAFTAIVPLSSRWRNGSEGDRSAAHH
jgi:hypothetical protein